jgi:hypothetical protein
LEAHQVAIDRRIAHARSISGLGSTVKADLAAGRAVDKALQRKIDTEQALQQYNRDPASALIDKINSITETLKRGKP